MGVTTLYGYAMDRAPTISYLQAVEEHVASGKQDIADQHDLISMLERTGHAPTSAIARLREMEKVQARHIVDRDRLRAELEVLDAVEGAKGDIALVPGNRNLQYGPKRRIRRTPYGRR